MPEFPHVEYDIGTYVEIPIIHDSMLDTRLTFSLKATAREVIKELIRSHGIQHELFGDHAIKQGMYAGSYSRTQGYLIPLEQWAQTVSGSVEDWQESQAHAERASRRSRLKRFRRYY